MPGCDDGGSKPDASKAERKADSAEGGAAKGSPGGEKAGEGGSVKRDEGRPDRPKAVEEPKAEGGKPGPVGLFGKLEDARSQTACNTALTLQQAVEQYMVMKRGKCPKSVEDLKAAGFTSRAPLDPWKSPYSIECPGENSHIEVRSAGPDAELNTDDDLIAGPPDSSCKME